MSTITDAAIQEYTDLYSSLDQTDKKWVVRETVAAMRHLGTNELKDRVQATATRLKDLVESNEDTTIRPRSLVLHASLLREYKLRLEEFEAELRNGAA